MFIKQGGARRTWNPTAGAGTWEGDLEPMLASARGCPAGAAAGILRYGLKHTSGSGVREAEGGVRRKCGVEGLAVTSCQWSEPADKQSAWGQGIHPNLPDLLTSLTSQPPNLPNKTTAISQAKIFSLCLTLTRNIETVPLGNMVQPGCVDKVTTQTKEENPYDHLSKCQISVW